MKRSKCLVGILVAGGVLVRAYEASASIPLFPRIAAVEFMGGVGSASNSQCGGTGYDFPLADVSARLFFQLVAAPCLSLPPNPPLSESECIEFDKNLTECVDICFKKSGQKMECPGDDWCNPNISVPAPDGKDFVFYSKSRNIGSLAGILARDSQLYMPQSKTFSLPATMADADTYSGTAFFIRINRRTRNDGLNQTTNLPESGAAYIPQRLATSSEGKFEVWGNKGIPVAGNPQAAPQDDAPPFSLADVCTQGTKIGFGPALAGRRVCTTLDQASLYANFFDKLDFHQNDVIQRQLNPNNRHLAWTNGGGSASCQPLRVMLASHVDAFGQAGKGRFFMNPDNFVLLDPTSDPFVKNKPAFDVHRLGNHEYFHMLQNRWQQESPAASPHIQILKEEHAEIVTYNSCLSLDNTDPNKCISGIKLRPLEGWGLKALQGYEIDPSTNAVFTDYSGAAFQLYVNEQFWPCSSIGPWGWVS